MASCCCGIFAAWPSLHDLSILAFRGPKVVLAFYFIPSSQADRAQHCGFFFRSHRWLSSHMYRRAMPRVSRRRRARVVLPQQPSAISDAAAAIADAADAASRSSHRRCRRCRQPSPQQPSPMPQQPSPMPQQPSPMLQQPPAIADAAAAIADPELQPVLQRRVCLSHMIWV